MKYGIKVPLALDHHGEYNDWLWVTQGDGKFQLEPLLFEEKELAEEYALKVWGYSAIVEEYVQNKEIS